MILKITKKRKTFTAAEFSARLAEKFCQELASANCEDRMNSSAKNIHLPLYGTMIFTWVIYIGLEVEGGGGGGESQRVKNIPSLKTDQS